MNANHFPDETSELTKRLDTLSGGYQRSQILFTGIRTGVFQFLTEPRGVEETAQFLQSPIRGARMLLDGLLALELITKKEDRYQNAPIAMQCLVPGAPMDQTHILRHRANAWEDWARLEEAVRTGQPVCKEARHGESLETFIRGMHDIAQTSAQALVRRVDLSSHTHMLDIGAGSGAYTIAALKQHPELHVTAFDRPEVLRITREYVEQAGLAERVSFVAGDLTKALPKGPYDLILISNIIHSFGPETNRKLIHACHDILTPGGLLIVKDFLRGRDGSASSFTLIFALQMFLRTPEGDTYSVADMERWSRDAGFPPGSVVELTPHTRLWLAHKAGGA